MTEDMFVNRCIVCGIDMGECNPRQYCMKLYCPKQFEMDSTDVDSSTDELLVDLTGDDKQMPEVIDLTTDDKPMPEVIDISSDDEQILEIVT